jgi:3-oxoacyl-[acyl-carrier-protein] synthase II
MLPGVDRPEDLLEPSMADVGGAEADPALRLGGRGLRYKDRATRLALAAARSALEDAEVWVDGALTVPGETVGVVASSNLGNVDTVCSVVETISRQTVAGTSPMDLPNASSNVVASSIAIMFQLRGVNLMVCNGATSGLDAMHLAVLLLAAGRVEHVLVVGVETTNHVVERLVRAGTSGVTGPPGLLDGAVGLVVESSAHALGRGAPRLGRIGAYARRGSLAEAVARVCRTSSGTPRAWLVPDAEAGRLPAGFEGVPALDFTRRLGRCSGALGVLQVAAGLAWLNRLDRDGEALLTVGGDGDDAVAAMLVRGGRGLS